MLVLNRNKYYCKLLLNQDKRCIRHSFDICSKLAFLDTLEVASSLNYRKCDLIFNTNLKKALN